MDTNILHAVDTLYLQMFQQNLLAELRRAHVMFRHHLKQSNALASAQELPAGFRQNYAQVAERLLPLIDALGSMESELENGDLSWQMLPDEGDAKEPLQPRETETTAVIAWLDSAENGILDVLNHVGECLSTLPHSIISWSDCGFFKVHVELRQLPERACYKSDAPIDIRSHPDFCADYFARKKIDKETKSNYSPHYLLDELIPLTLLPLIADLWIEMDVHGDGYVSS